MFGERPLEWGSNRGEGILKVLPRIPDLFESIAANTRSFQKYCREYQIFSKVLPRIPDLFDVISLKGIFHARVSNTNTNKENGEEEKGRVPCDKKYIFHFQFLCNTKSVNRLISF